MGLWEVLGPSPNGDKNLPIRKKNVLPHVISKRKIEKQVVGRFLVPPSWNASTKADGSMRCPNLKQIDSVPLCMSY